MIHICPCIRVSSSYSGYFNGIHIVKFRTIGGCIDCIALLRVLEILSEDKKKCLVENIIEHLIGALGSYVVDVMIEKDCSARSTLLKAYVNSYVEPTHKCHTMKEKMLLYKINIVI